MVSQGRLRTIPMVRPSDLQAHGKGVIERQELGTVA